MSEDRIPAPIPQLALLQLATGYMVSQAVYVAAKLGLADLVAEAPQTALELAESAGADPSALHRLLRMLATFGVFQQDELGRFGQSAISTLLQSQVAGSFRPAVIMWNEEQYRAWGDILHSIKTGETAFDHVFGMGLFSYLEKNPPVAANFDAAMTNLTTPMAAGVIETYEFTDCRTVVDIGGGQGLLLGTILRAFPGVRGVLFDTVPVIADAERYLSSAGFRGRCELVGGSFFENVPIDGDVYILAQVLHNWDDERSIAILRNCQRAMRVTSKLLVIEALLATGSGSGFAALSDMHMLAVVGGRERTGQEYRELFSRAGLKLRKILPTAGPQSILEAVPSEAA